MSPLLETIKLKEGKLFNLEFHNRRFNKARKEYFGVNSELDLGQKITIPDEFKLGLFRCRIIYSPEIEKVEFISHQYQKVESLKLVVDDLVDYRFKYNDRCHLQMLYDKRGECDDILIVKDGYITDSYTANPIFFDGIKWWTPDSVLLPGTQREKLLQETRIFECQITPDDLHKYQKAGLINAMQDVEDMPVICVGKVMW